MVFRWLKTTENIAQQSSEPNQPKLDLSLKEGQTIHINLKVIEYIAAQSH